MTSPLYPYINSRVLFPGVVDVVNVSGRFEEVVSDRFLVKAWMKRVEYSGVSSGSKRIPLESQLDGQMMPGASGDQFYYRGYSLEYAAVPPEYDLRHPEESGLTFNPVHFQHPWMKTGQELPFVHGEGPVLVAKVQRSDGVYGGIGIDQVLYKEIGGVQLQLTASEVQN